MSALLFVLLASSCEEATRNGDGASASGVSQKHRAVSAEGVFVAEIWPREGEVPLHRIHDWVLRVETPDGERVDPTRVTVSGGMPQHGHGLPTRPRATDRLPNGDLLIEGLKFNMHGRWLLRLEIFAGPAIDSVDFDLDLAP